MLDQKKRGRPVSSAPTDTYSSCSVNPPRRIYRILKFGARSGGFTERRVYRTDFEISETLLLRLITQRSRSIQSSGHSPLLSNRIKINLLFSLMHLPSSLLPPLPSFPQRYLIKKKSGGFTERQIYRTRF